MFCKDVRFCRGTLENNKMQFLKTSYLACVELVTGHCNKVVYDLFRVKYWRLVWQFLIYSSFTAVSVSAGLKDIIQI